jgi:hypothetical protein
MKKNKLESNVKGHLRLVGKDTVEMNVFKSKDYSKFNLIKGNRTLHKTKYLQLLKSMEQEVLSIPIAVNEKMEIIDGQHRFHARRELGLPILYYVCDGYGIEQVKRANLVSSNWTKEDYLNLHITDGIEAYEEFEELLLDSGLNVTDLIKVYAKAQAKSSEQVSYEFENGTLSNDNLDKVKDFISALKDFDFFKFFRKKQFVAAMIKLFFDPRYDHNKMKKKLSSRSTVLEGIGANVTKDEYLSKLTNAIYSFGAGNKNIYYDSTNKRFYE